MLSNFFKVKVNTQVLDPLTKIWEVATINSLWEVAEKYQRRFKNGTIEIPDELAKWRQKMLIQKCNLKISSKFRLEEDLPGNGNDSMAQKTFLLVILYF